MAVVIDDRFPTCVDGGLEHNWQIINTVLDSKEPSRMYECDVCNSAGEVVLGRYGPLIFYYDSEGNEIP